MEPPECVNPDAPETTCAHSTCQRIIKTCIRPVPIESAGHLDERCPKHPKGIPWGNRWVCDEGCREMFEQEETDEILREAALSLRG